jgi:hypothetical protein
LQRILALATYIVGFKESKVSQHTKPYQKIASAQKNTANVPLISSKLLKQKFENIIKYCHVFSDWTQGFHSNIF